jgi:hypothetical protein
MLLYLVISQLDGHHVVHSPLSELHLHLMVTMLINISIFGDISTTWPLGWFIVFC